MNTQGLYWQLFRQEVFSMKKQCIPITTKQTKKKDKTKPCEKLF